MTYEVELLARSLGPVPFLHRQPPRLRLNIRNRLPRGSDVSINGGSDRAPQPYTRPTANRQGSKAPDEMKVERGPRPATNGRKASRDSRAKGHRAVDTTQLQSDTAPARPEGVGQETPAHKLKVQVIGAGKRYLGIFFYLYVVFALFNVHEYIVLEQHGIKFTHYGFAAVNAFVMAKALMIGEELHLGEYFDDRPLICPILLSSLLFGILLIFFRIIEQMIDGLWNGHTMAESIPSFGGGGLTGIIMVGTIISVTLIPFFALRYIRREIGGPQLYALLFVRGRKKVTIEVTMRLQSDGQSSAGAA